jgi:hypothetical protein
MVFFSASSVESGVVGVGHLPSDAAAKVVAAGDL